MKASRRGNSKTIACTAEEFLRGPTRTNTTDTGSTTKWRAQGISRNLMVLSSKVNFSMVKNKAKGSKSGKWAICIMATGLMDKEKDMACLHGQMEPNTQDNSKTTRNRVKESIPSQMAPHKTETF